MDKHTFSVLEFQKIKELLKKNVISATGEQIVEKITPLTDQGQVLAAQRETTEMREIIRYEGTLPFTRLEDVNIELKKSEIKGAILDSTKILRILKVLTTSRLVKKFLLKTKEKYPLIKERANKIIAFPELEKEITNCIGEDGLVLDRASSNLKKIRREIINKEQVIKKRLESIIRSSQFATIIQEPLVTIRQDRYVIPIKQERKGKFPGIAHDKSDSGATLFVEPLEIVELNNTLRQLIKEEEKEVLKILQKLTTLIGEKAHDIYYSLLNLGEIDFIHARAMLANKMEAIEPKLNQKGFINLVQARHPLLKGNVVPININLGKDFNVLVITGPNTGGKTVTLKTVGLLSLMAQCGLHIPANKGSEVVVFQKIFCDIGDEQSIEQNLSTFSSHMKYIVQILKEANSKSLVLLDELGAGTDPTEGAALGMAILDFLNKEKVKVLATTHHDSLKAYAYLTKGVCNARVEFDEKTLKPTFQISIGLPGKSCAFIIARRLGLTQDVVLRAQSFLTQEKLKVDNLLEKIEQDKKIIEQEMELIKISKEETFKIKKELKELNEEIKTKLMTEEKSIKNRDIKVGDCVRVKSLNKQGIIQAISEKSGKCKIQIDNMKIIVPILDIEKIENLDKLVKNFSSTRNEVSKRSVTQDNFYLSKVRTFKKELSLRRLSVEDAKLILEKYLDDAYLLGISPVYIIHGKGKGILREEVRKLLGNIPYIKSFRPGDANEGGIGVTVVYLKK